MAPENNNNQEATITLSAGQALRGLLFAVAIIGGYPVYDSVASRGILGTADCSECKKLVLRIEELEKQVDVNTQDLWSRHNKRWNLPDQQVWGDLLQELNPNINVPNPRNGN